MILPVLQDAFDQAFPAATPIQTALFDRLTAGESLFGLAPTGSGKTLAFALPLLSRLDQSKKQTEVIILAPSQELGAQLARVIRPYAKLVGAQVLPLIGGANGKRQADKLKKEKPAIVVGTLGRILTMANGGALKLKQVRSLVIDEADAVLIADHQDSLQELAALLPPLEQVALFSATSGVDLAAVQALFGRAVTPVSVANEAPKQIQHTYLPVDRQAQNRVLVQLARAKEPALVFFNTVGALVAAQATLRHEHARVMALGKNEKSHLKRADALQAFKKGDLDLLLATDVAARGLDIAGLPLVVNAQIPNNLTTYLHRTGRTGRAGQPGLVLNLGNDHDLRTLRRYLPDSMTLTKYDWSAANRRVKQGQAAEQQVASHKETSTAADSSQTPATEQQIAPTKVERQDQPKAATKARAAVKRKKAPADQSAPVKKAKKKHSARKNKQKGKPKWAR
ncbi:DEAD/DEAH box helicase [Leuconostocaceae bacterium ESL0958]|nr:DEAD/DEAH box helicase [Leuconostocaceae bacterium ESL0958]